MGAVHLRWLPLLAISLLARALAPFAPALSLGLYLLAIAGTTAVAAANIGLTGAKLIAVGGALNLVVVILNGGMPVDPGAVATAGATMPSDALHVPLTEATRLSALGDVIGFALLHAVYSVGDFCIAIGGFVVPFALLARR
jgi:hypothetical protein